MLRFRAIIGGAALLLAATVGLAGPASAGSVGSGNSVSGSPTAVSSSGPLAKSTGTGADTQCLDFLFPGVNIRSAPNTGSSIRGQGNPGDCVNYHGAVTGQNTYCPEGSFWTNQWYDVTNQRTGVRGLVLRCYIG